MYMYMYMYKQVTVPTVNVNRLLFENTIPGDYAIVKMDNIITYNTVYSCIDNI